MGITVSCDGKSFSFTDATGDYDATTNPGGYGNPNISSSYVEQAFIGVYQYKATVPYLFTFTISTNVVTDATVTAPDGTVTNIFSDITDDAFPFTGSSAFTMLNTYLGYSEDQKIQDMVWTFSYEIKGSYVSGITHTFDTATTCDYLVSCNTECCVKKMFVNLGCACCDDGKLMSALKAKAELQSAKYSAEVGQYCAAQNSITKAASLCGCNCGC
jgi:hypothetical protein